jgi:hypothetical protein
MVEYVNPCDAGCLQRAEEEGYEIRQNILMLIAIKMLTEYDE